MNTVNSIHKLLERNQSADLSLVNGKLGVLVFYSYSFLNNTGGIDKDKIEELFNEIVTAYFTEDEIDLSYAGGITGLLSVISHFKSEEKLDFFQSIVVNEIHEPIFIQAKKWIDCDFIDNLYGTIGILHYFSQSDDTSTEVYINELTELLISKAINIDFNRVAFINSFPDRQKENFDFGLAHGMSGMLSVLLDVYEKNKSISGLYSAIIKCIQYVLQSKINMEAEHGHYSFFPLGYDRITQEYTLSNRLAWCYGDLNQVMLFYKAGRILDKKEYVDYGHIFGMATLSRKNEISTGVRDSAFCHGSSGLAYLYLNLYTQSQEDNYLKAYEFWIAETLVLANRELDQNLNTKENINSLLDGVVGTGLVLLSSLYPENLTWSKFLFI
ncbi:hypothetical protein TH53_04415 [Pedobacter lusitanus]|uniref:Lanthionine synthetase C-like protein n=2 Tax=Pedobacter lusitanus TaxID=1503925 RepID=A0A0D0GV31_9SPHI|nr:hypothetical protein TH53_04415 [Pedobacter lusitanus]